MFDSDTTGSNVIFMLDHSESMAFSGKSAAARKELLRNLQAMKPERKFYVMFFHSGGYDGMPTIGPDGPVEATPKNINYMTNWLFSEGHKFGSDPTKAIERGLGLVPAPDTLWLLTDGKFSQDVVAFVHTANDAVHAHINTIGFYSPEGEPVLRQIASENQGIYRFIPKPDKNAKATSDAIPPPPAASDGKPASSP